MLIIVEARRWERGDSFYSCSFCKYSQLVIIKNIKRENTSFFPTRYTKKKMTYTRSSKCNQFQKLEIVHLTFCDRNAIKLRIDNKSGK